MRDRLYLISLILIITCSKISSSEIVHELSCFYNGLSEQGPFDFFNPVPARVKSGDKIDLSFSVNSAIVSQYRYRLDIPGERDPSIAKALISWSTWMNNAFTDVIILKINQEGRYNLRIEYKSQSANDVKLFEKSFEVYKDSPLIPVANQQKSGIGKENSGTRIPSNAESIKEDYPKLLMEAIERKDSNLVRNSVLNGAGNEIKGTNGGNIFHLMNGTVANENLISVLKNKGISINETDDFGNTPLHVAIMKRDDSYARCLINQGADLNIRNKINLAPLHLSAFLNDNVITNDLISKGAEVNIKGNSGYTPLHIASLMNNFDVARDLLRGGALKALRTDQKLTPVGIAKIQKYDEMVKLIGRNGTYTVNFKKSNRLGSDFQMSSVKLNPQFEINLKYNDKLLKQRKTNKVFQIISIPVFALSAAGTTFLRIEADGYYNKYKNADTQDTARNYYNKTREFDTYTYISGSVSFISLYGFIHSTVKRNSVTNKMRKTIY